MAGTRLAARTKLRKLGYSFRDINGLMDGLDGDTAELVDSMNGGTLAALYDAHVASGGADPTPSPGPTPSPTPHPFRDFLAALFANPQFMQFVMQLIMSLIGGSAKSAPMPSPITLPV